MKCITPEISWHNRDPVLSIDIQPKRTTIGDIYRLASGGTDSHVLIWYMTHTNEDTINLEIAADLTRHQRAVNVVRWSPSGEYLASGDDESNIFIWKLKNELETINILDSTNDQDKETWLTYKVLRGHMEDVYDLCWSPNSTNLISGSVDNTAIVWDVTKGKSTNILTDHKSFVQGVAWDPQNKLLATLSTDRSMRVFDVATKKVLTCSSKATVPINENHPLYGKSFRIFHDDTLQSFYRRLCFSPDGELIITPSGVVELDPDSTKPVHTTYIYTRYNTKNPAIILPTPDQYTIAIRCCPILFELNEVNDNVLPVVSLPYRMIFAVATKCSVYLYDTQQTMPFGIISNIHYCRLTDVTWSSDGRILIVSSTDGFCTLISFSAGELGKEYFKKEQISDITIQENKVHNNLSAKDILNKQTQQLNDQIKDDKHKNENVMKPNEKKTELDTQTFDVDNKMYGKATPIEIRRVPRNVVPKELNIQPTPIAVRREPRIVNTNSAIGKSVEVDHSEPTRIPIRREPRIPTQTIVANSINVSNDQLPENNSKVTLVKNDTTPNQIPIRKKPKLTDTNNETIVQSVEKTEVKGEILKSTTTALLPISLEIPSSIISSEEKFDSTKIYNKPATPIQIRREPRKLTPTSQSVKPVKSSTSIDLTGGEIQFQTLSKLTISTPSATKVTNPSKNSTTKKNKSSAETTGHKRKLLSPTGAMIVEDEALDAWPIDQPRPKVSSLITNIDNTKSTIPLKSNVDQKPTATATTLHSMDTSDEIHLIYDGDSQTDTEHGGVDGGNELDKPIVNKEKDKQLPTTPNPKPPRRVELKTLSTPKSKKKLL